MAEEIIGQGKEEAELPNDVVFAIIMRNNNPFDIKIDGPLSNKVLCLWMLEIGKNLMMAFNPNQSNIVKPKSGIMDFARRGRFK